MAARTDFDPEGILRLLDTVGAVGEDLTVALHRLRALRASVAQPWGPDEYGEKFAQQHEGNAAQLLQYIDDVIAFIAELCSQGRTALQGFESLDRDNGRGLS